MSKPWLEGEPSECDGSAWDRLPPLVKAKRRDIIVIDMQEGRNWADCHMCGKFRRLDHAVAWYCGPTHDEIGSVSTEYISSTDEPAIVGGMCVCKDCHDSHYSTLTSHHLSTPGE